MPRTISASMKAAQEKESYKFLAKATVFPSRAYFSAIVDNDPWVEEIYEIAADGLGILDNPQAQDIAYNATVGGLVTVFFDQWSDICYSIQGNSTPVITGESGNGKPSIYGNKLFVHWSRDIDRYSIDWDKIAALEDDPFTYDTHADIRIGLDVHAVHGVSETEVIGICEDSGGYRIVYVNGTTVVESTDRFMFPLMVESDELDGKTLSSMAKYSGAAKLGNKIFVYISAPNTGMVYGMYYDLDAETWSNVFTAVPTDLTVSMCEFAVTNVYTHNNTIYMCGLFNRTDAYEGSQPYTLLMPSTDGITFAMNRQTLITMLGYRFHACPGSDGNLYFGHCNRVTSVPTTWYFNGDQDATVPQLALSADNILSISGNVDGLSVVLAGGNEVLRENAYIAEGSKFILHTGYETTEGEEYVDYSTYIIGPINKSRTDASKGLSLSCIHISQWNASALSMPFYAEIIGVSSIYEPFKETTGLMYAAPGASKYTEEFWIDFWKRKGGDSPIQSVDGDLSYDAGPIQLTFNGESAPDTIVQSDDIKNTNNLSDHPIVTDSTISMKLYAHYTGKRDLGTIDLGLVHTADDGTDEQTTFCSQPQMPTSKYPSYQAGDGFEYLSFSTTDIGVGRKILRAQILQENAARSLAVGEDYGRMDITRLEFTAGIACPVDSGGWEITWKTSENGYIEIPGTGAPMIMFSQKPYNAFSFDLSAMFENTVTGTISGFPIAVGLVGLAKDAANYILARYDDVTNKVALIKVRDGKETTLTDSSVGFDPGTSVIMRFIHRDGNFEIYVYNTSTSLFSKIIDYDWKSWDGYICADVISSLKCGIYGYIATPQAEVLGFSHDQHGGGYLGIGPMASLTGFPSSDGYIVVGETKFHYDSLISQPTERIGPLSYERNINIVPLNAPRFFCRNLFTGRQSPISGKIITAETYGTVLGNYAIWDEWSVGTIPPKTPVNWPFCGFVPYNVSIDPEYQANTSGTWHRFYVTGGFVNVRGMENTGYIGHRETIKYVYPNGTIRCYWFMGSGGEAQETTIQEMVKRTAALAGIQTIFPGNVETASLAISGSTSLGEDLYADHLDLSFNISAPQSFELTTNIKIKPDNYEVSTTIDGDTGLKVVVTNVSGSSFTLKVVSTPSNTEMYAMSYTSGTSTQKFRFILHENALSVYQCNRWIATITFDELIYDQTDRITASLNNLAGSFTITDLIWRELADAREAVYIDLETDAQSAIGSIIQERPVEIVSQPDGSMAVYYEYERTPVTMGYPPNSHNENESLPREAASDAIIYGSHSVKTLQFQPFAAIMGLATKVFRFPNLNTGMLEAALRTLRKIYGRRKMTRISSRPLLDILVGDRVDIDYDLAVLNKNVTGSIIVETMDISISNTSQKMTTDMNITGRNYDE